LWLINITILSSISQCCNDTCICANIWHYQIHFIIGITFPFVIMEKLLDVLWRRIFELFVTMARSYDYYYSLSFVFAWLIHLNSIWKQLEQNSFAFPAPTFSLLNFPQKNGRCGCKCIWVDDQRFLLFFLFSDIVDGKIFKRALNRLVKISSLQ